MKVVILAGGKGTRLGLEGIPKPMVLVDGVPLLERLVLSAKSYGFKDFIFLTGYLSEVIESHFGDGARFGIKIEHVIEPEPLGTAGCFDLIREQLKDPFIVLYGDILIDVDLRHFADIALKNGAAGTLFVHPNDHPFDSDLLEVDQDSRIIKFHPKPHPDHSRLPNLVSAALYILYPQALQFVTAGQSLDWGKDIFPALVERLPLYAYRSVEYAKDIGTKPRLEKAERHLSEGRVARLSRHNYKAAIFLDRDGVLNEERDGVFDTTQLILLPGVSQAVRSINDAGIPAICVTNQPGLAKGQLTWQTLNLIHAELDCQLADGAGSYLDDMLICPHHPEAGWPGEVAALKIECDCRKPSPGLLLRAAQSHGIDLKKSWLIGDRYCDLAAAAAVGAKTILLTTGHAGNDQQKYPDIIPDAIFTDLSTAVSHILETLK